MGKSIKKAVKKTFSNPIRSLTAIGTFGTSEIARKIPQVDQVLGMPERLLGYGRPGAPDLPAAPGGMSPTDLLAQTGGAPLLANISLGVDPEEALAGYFGKNKKDGSWQEFLQTLSQKDFDSINSVHGQLTTIQSTRDLRQKAVDNVLADFPNIAKNAAVERANAGGEFDEVTKGYMDQALKGTAAKFAAGGGLSSGAMNEAVAKVGAEQGMAKLGYMGEREQFKYNTGANEMNARLGEVNALRDFQNTMLGGQVQQGFSAQQANLQRQFQGGMANADMANQRSIANQQGNNALFGALGSLGGSFIGAQLLGGSSLFGGAKKETAKTTNSYYDKISENA